jgi:prophage endopeptidase
MIALRAAWLFMKGVPSWVYLVIALLIGIYFYGVHEKNAGRTEVKAEWDAEILKRTNAEKAAVIARVAENQVIFKRQEIDSANIKKAHDDEISTVRTALAKSERLRAGSAICGGPASKADTQSAGGSNGADPGGALVREDVQRDIDALKLKVESAFAAGRACQAFVKANGMAP